jgi:hypothetical protein
MYGHIEQQKGKGYEIESDDFPACRVCFPPDTGRYDHFLTITLPCDYVPVTIPPSKYVTLLAHSHIKMSTITIPNPAAIFLYRFFIAFLLFSKNLTQCYPKDNGLSVSIQLIPLKITNTHAILKPIATRRCPVFLSEARYPAPPPKTSRAPI